MSQWEPPLVAAVHIGRVQATAALSGRPECGGGLNHLQITSQISINGGDVKITGKRRNR